MIKREAKFDEWEFQSIQVNSYDTGEKFAQACLMRKRSNGFMEHSCYCNEFTEEIQKQFDEGCTLEDIYIIASANNTIHWRTQHEFTEDSIEQFLKDAAQHWKVKRATLRKQAKEFEDEKRQQEIKKLQDMGISKEALQDFLNGKNLPEHKPTIAPGRKLEKVAR